MSIDAVTAGRLHDLVESFRGRRVAVVGDLVVDEFVHGDIDRVSREAPVLILEHRDTVTVPGGGGNAVTNLRALDAHPMPVGVVGKDDQGRRLLRSFRERGIRTSGIVQDPDYLTPTKSRVIAGGVHTRRQQVVRVDRGSSHGSRPPATRKALRERLAVAMRRAHGLLVADYDYGAATPSIIRTAASAAMRRGLPVTVDSRGRVEDYRNLTACTPNQEELENAVGSGPLADDAVEGAGRDLLRRTGHTAVLVTCGARGMIVHERRRPAVHIPAFGSDEVADVTGAGDTVIAVFTLALVCGGSFVEAAILANHAAGMVVMKAGTATVGREEMHAAIDEDLVS